jgi:hypothetical protein
MPRLVELTAHHDFANPKQTRVVANGFMGETEMVLPITVGQFAEGMTKWDGGDLIQRAFPTLNAGAREFLMTGLPAETQERVFAEPDA